MLTALTINDVVLIDKLALALAPGLNVFTGETGAGKSIVLDALGLALGGRSDAALIRTGAAQASVTAEFSLPGDHGVFVLAEEQGLSAENPLILRRVIGKDGKSRAFVNDQPISIGLLRQFGERLLEIHGQFEAHGLLDASTHRGLLDAFADSLSASAGVSPPPLGGGLGEGSTHSDDPSSAKTKGLLQQTKVFASSPQGGKDSRPFGELKQKIATAFAAWKEAEEKQREALATRERAQAEEDFLRAAAAELDELMPEAGEAEKLAERRTNLQHREKIGEALAAAQQNLDGERGATAALAQAGKAVARVADKAVGLQDLLTAIDRAANETAEASQQLEKFIGSLDAEPDALEKIEERLFALRACARKHNVPVDNLADLRKDFASKLGLLADRGDQIAALAKAAAEAKQAYVKLATELSAKRKQAALQLAKAVMKELPPLKLERAKFEIDIAPLPEDQWSAQGADRIAFLAATNPGTAAGQLQKIASGGELARFMLALKVVLAAADPVPTLVFDEVDAGIGGAVASSVGDRLARLAAHVQILVVTHSPQVAARGSHHLRVSKQMKAKQMITQVETLNAEARQEEIARMLAGTQVTDAARKAALSLMKDFVGPVPVKKPPKRARA